MDEIQQPSEPARGPSRSASRSPGLPEPAPEAAAASRALSERIVAAIAAAGGWIGFDRYMTMALYEPGLGYYSSGKPVFGPVGDFVTAPELTPLFGATLSRQIGSWLAACDAPQPLVIEFGAGSGTLAAQLLNALERQGFGNLRYQIVELSADLRRQQRKTIAARLPQMVDRVEWLDAMPSDVRGVVIGNEVLDAMPVRTFEWDGARLLEVGVGVVDGRLAWAGRPADAGLEQLVKQLGVDRSTWHLPYRSEVCPQQSAWLATVAGAMRSGAILLLDYGFPAAEYYHPQRVGGTLMSHYRHRALTDPFVWPGLQDITAHVDFSRLLAAGDAAGLQPLGYTSQARFLLNCGLLDELEALPRDEQRLWFSQAQAVQRLVSEAEMGELFKVVAFGKGLPATASLPGFSDGDRLEALR
jgi:SAM-dependent MidA family methyltransferase